MRQIFSKPLPNLPLLALFWQVSIYYATWLISKQKKSKNCDISFPNWAEIWELEGRWGNKKFWGNYFTVSDVRVSFIFKESSLIIQMAFYDPGFEIWWFSWEARKKFILLLMGGGFHFIIKIRHRFSTDLLSFLQVLEDPKE